MFKTFGAQENVGPWGSCPCCPPPPLISPACARALQTSKKKATVSLMYMYM